MLYEYPPPSPFKNLVSPERIPFHREEPGSRALLTLTVALGLGLLLQGCVTPPRGQAVPTALERTDFDRSYMQKLYDVGFKDAKAGIIGRNNLRCW